MAMQGAPRLVRPSIRFMGVAARTEVRKRRVNLARQLLRRRDAVVAPSPVRASPPSGTPAAGQLPLPDRSRPTPPAHPPSVRGRRSSPSGGQRIAPAAGPRVGVGVRRPAQAGAVDVTPSAGIGGHGVLTLALVAVT